VGGGVGVVVAAQAVEGWGHGRSSQQGAPEDL